MLSAHAQALLVDSFDVTFHFLINKDGSSFAPTLNLSWEAVALGVGPISSAQYLPCFSLCVFAAFLKKIYSLDLICALLLRLLLMVKVVSYV